MNSKPLSDQVIESHKTFGTKAFLVIKGDEIIHESYPDNSFSYDQNIFEYIAELHNKKSRYIRVKGLNIDKCPEYHPGAGGASWVFADEIIVK